jgi:hypothetical protein
MFRNTGYSLILILSVTIYTSNAQNSQVLYNMNLPQKHLLNPALRSTNSVYIGLPGFSGVNININNNFVNFSDLFLKGQKDSVISFLHPSYDADKFLAKIGDKNSIEPEATVPLFGLGFSAGKDLYIFLDINERIEGNLVLPGDIIRLALKGNDQFVGSKIDLSSLRGDVKYYREIGLGFSKNFTNKLRIGVKGKLLFGITAASIDNRSLGIEVNSDYSHTLDADVTVNFSAPVKAYMGKDNKLDSLVFDDSRFEKKSEVIKSLFNTKNAGLAFDIGATYNVTDKFVASAAITDIGFIKWKTDITSLQAKSNFKFSGLDMVDVLNGTITFDSLVNQMVDSLKNSFSINDAKAPFTTFMPYGITLGGNYNLTKSFSVGLLSYSRIIGKQLKEALTLSANVNLGNALSVSLAYTAANHRYDNLGVGFAFRAGFFQFFTVVDRIPVTWNKIITESGNKISVPASWNTINTRFGINFVFGNKVKKKDDKPMVLVD